MARSRANSYIRRLLLVSPWSRHGQSGSRPLPGRQPIQSSSSSEQFSAAAGPLSFGLGQRTRVVDYGSRGSRLTTMLRPSHSASIPHQFTPRYRQGSSSVSDGISFPSVCQMAQILPGSIGSCVSDDNATTYRTENWQSRNAGTLLSGAFATIFGLGVLLEQLESEPAWSEKAESELKGAGEQPKAAGVVEALLKEIKSICDEDRVTVDEDERDLHGKPWNSYHKVANMPDIVVYPKSIDEVVGVVKLCDKYKVPITPYGGATSLEGHTIAPYGGVSIDMTMMKEVKALHIEDMDVVVEPGIGWMELNEYLAPHGLFFPLDPGPGATIGGMCATRCSGSLAMRYGTMRENVIALKAVMPNGDVVKSASRARKSSAGYDLTRLLIGSEGTLGVIAEVTLRLQKIPQASTVAMSNFPTIKDAADVAIAIQHSGIQASRIELLDDRMMKAVNMGNGTNYPEKPTLMFELVGTDAYVVEQTKLVKKIAEEHQSTEFHYALTPEEKVELWKIRKEAFWSALLLKPDTEAMTTDVCVPLSRLAECIEAAKLQLDASSLETAILSHAGDGNFHAILLFDPNKKEEVEEAHRLADTMVHTALALDGTCTGEHGIGVGKIKYLEKELGPEAMRTMGTIKKSLDPSNVMNPGKVLPPKFCY